MNRKQTSALDDLSSDLERMFDSFLGRTVGNVLRTGSSEGYAPAVDLSETPDRYLVCVDLPGAKPEEVTVEFQDGLLFVSGKRTRVAEVPDELLKQERFEGRFNRSVPIPGEVNEEAIEAAFSLGVLSVVLPKVQSKSPTKIKIKTTE